MLRKKGGGGDGKTQTAFCGKGQYFPKFRDGGCVQEQKLGEVPERMGRGGSGFQIGNKRFLEACWYCIIWGSGKRLHCWGGGRFQQYSNRLLEE